MAITVNFRTHEGIVTSRQFRSGDRVSIYGKATSLIGAPDLIGTRVRLSIDEIAYYQDTRTNLFGDYAGFVQFPSTPGRGTLNVTVYRPLGTETVSVPVSWGEARPEPLDIPPSETGIGETISGALSTVKFVAIAAIVLAGVYFLMPVKQLKRK